MPNRIIKESLCFSDDIDALTPFEETVFVRLIVNVDDYGRLDARPALLRNMLFRTKDSVTRKNVEDALSKLVTVGLVRLYEVDRKPFLSLPKWEKHQQVRAKKSKYPAPDINLQSSDINGNQEIEDVPDIQSLSESLSLSEDIPPISPKGGERPKRTRFIPPSIEAVKAYCRERGNEVDAQRFVDYYTANGWMVGKNKMKDWKAAVRTWEGNQKKQNKPPLQVAGGGAANPFAYALEE